MQTSSAMTIEPFGELDYETLVRDVGSRFAQATGPLFLVEVPDIWERYLAGFEEGLRQYHNCHACRAFIEHAGRLVTIDERGSKHSAIWHREAAAGTPYEASFAAMREAVEKPSATITSVFLFAGTRLGEQTKGRCKNDDGEWSHLFCDLPAERAYRGKALTAWQAAAEKTEDVKNVRRALGEFSLELLEQAVQLLNSDALYRSEKVAGPVEWLRDLKVATEETKDQRVRANLIWRAVAAAPAGFCHPRASMAGTLLEDLATGKGFEWAASRFKAKMHPLQYQRPQAAPSEGAIAAAEKLVEQLGIARSLERRFARIDEIQTIWRPTVTEKPAPEGVFSHLRFKGQEIPALSVPGKPITWEKFAATVLPGARRIEVKSPHVGNYCAFLTAVHDDAPPVLQWDSAERRNPFSLYVYHNGSPAHQWRIIAGTWREVSAVSLRPSRWQPGFDHHGEGALLVLPGCVDTRENSGNALFPGTLRSDLHGARAVIERYSATAKVQGREEASACGLMVSKGAMGVRVRVHGAANIVTEYQIDRWE